MWRRKRIRRKWRLERGRKRKKGIVVVVVAAALVVVDEKITLQPEDDECSSVDAVLLLELLISF